MITITLLDPASLAPTPDVAFFAFSRVDYGPEATATEHPVEVGVAVTDHVQIRPLRLTVEVYVTASPLGTAVPFAVEDAIGFLERALGRACTLVIPKEGSFSPFVLEAAPHSRTAVEGRPFSLRFKQIRIAQAISVPIPPRQPAPVAQAGGPSEADLGESAPEEGKPKSNLATASDAGVGFVKSILGIGESVP